MQFISVGWRAVAVTIDSVILCVIGYGIAWFGGTTSATGFELQGGPFFLMLLLTFLYYILLEATLGASVGKLLLGLRVVKLDGSPIDWPAAIVRNILRLVDGLFFYLVGAILVWQSPQRQRLGDRVAGTVVVRQSST